MNASGDDRLPDKLTRDLHGLVPEMPQALSAREREMLAQAHVVLRRGNGRRFGAWPAAIAAAAALLVGVAIWQFAPAGAPRQQVALVREAPPTIVDALRAAKRPGARQAEVDQIAMAAVRLDQPEVQ